MIYAVSDLHGCSEKYKRLLETISFCNADTLYVLGDVVDRGDGGIGILLDMMERSNVIPIIGNHESLALGVMKKIAAPPAVSQSIQNTTAYTLWMLSGGDVTEQAFRALDKETQKKVIEYIESFMIYDEISVNGRRFHLSHTLPDYDPNKPIHDVSYLEFIYGEPDYSVTYGSDKLFVTGHTMTMLIDREFAGRIYQKNNHIAIDCGASFGYSLGCICLDTLEEIYVE